MDACRADERIDLRARVAVGAEEQQCGELVIQPAAVPGQHEDALRAHRGGQRRARARGRSRPSRADGARRGFRRPRRRRRLPATRSRSRPRRPSPRGRARAHARAPCRPRRRARRAAPPVPHEDPAALRPIPPRRSLPTRLPPLALPRSGSAGRRRFRPPSQPGCPSSPLRLGHRSDRYARRVTSAAADSSKHRAAGAGSRDALRCAAARCRRRHDHARPRHRDRVRPRPGACDLPDRRRARRTARRPSHGPVRARSRHRGRVRRRRGGLRADRPRMRRGLRAARHPRLPRYRRNERRRASVADSRRRHVSRVAQGAGHLVRPLRRAVRRRPRATGVPAAVRRKGHRARHARRPVAGRGGDVRRRDSSSRSRFARIRARSRSSSSAQVSRQVRRRRRSPQRRSARSCDDRAFRPQSWPRLRAWR